MSARQHVLQEISSSVYPLDVLDTKALVQIQCRPPWKAILKVSPRTRLLWHHLLRCNEYTSILLSNYCYNFQTYHCPNFWVTSKGLGWIWFPQQVSTCYTRCDTVCNNQDRTLPACCATVLRGSITFLKSPSDFDGPSGSDCHRVWPFHHTFGGS